MTQRTKTTLQTNLNADLADNTSGDISAADVRNNLIDFTDSVPFLASATNVVSGSFSGSFQGDGSNLTGVTVTTADTASSTPNALTTASVSLNTITFTKGDASTFNITIDTGSAGGSTFPYNGTAEIDGTLVLTGSLDMNSTVARTGTSASIAAAYVNISGDDYASIGSTTTTYLLGSSLTALNPSQVGNIIIENRQVFGSTKGYTKINAGDLYLTGSTINSTGTWTHANDLIIQEGVEISGSLGLTGSFTIGRADGSPAYDLGVYQIATASIQVDYLDMDLYESTLIKPTSIGSTQGNFEIRNTALFGGTKGYIKLDAGDLILSGSAVYIDPNSLPTTEPSDSGQLWLSGSAGSNSKVLCVRD